MARGHIIAIAGPAGVGKDTFIAESVKRGLGERITAWTTRPMRSSEQNGREYNFVGDDEFEELRNREYIFDESVLNGFRYGTPLRVVKNVVAKGRVGFIHLTTEGCRKLGESIPECTTIFLMPESRAQLVEHLTKRGSTPVEIEARLKADPVDWDRVLDFSLIVLSSSGKISASVDRLEAHLVEKGIRKSGKLAP